MSPPPTNIDGTEITGATIDGQDVEEITVDGDTVFTALPDIPASAVLQYSATTFNQGDPTWQDDTGTADITLNGGPTDATLSDGSDAIGTDGIDDNGELTLPSQFEGAGLEQFSIEIATQFSHTNENIFFGIRSEPNGQFIHLFANRDENNNRDTGNIQFLLSDQNANRMIVAPQTNPNLNDGNRHDITISVDDATTSSVSMIIDGSSVAVTNGESGNPSNFGSFPRPLRIWARDLDGSVGSFIQNEMGAMRWHDQSLSQQTISDYP